MIIRSGSPIIQCDLTVTFVYPISQCIQVFNKVYKFSNHHKHSNHHASKNIKWQCLQMYVNVVFVMSCLYSAVSLALVREQSFIRFFKDFFFIEARLKVR